MKSKQDPTGQARTRQKATRALNARLSSSEKSVRALLRVIPRTRRVKVDLKNNAVAYDYDVSPEEAEAMPVNIQRILNAELLESQNQMPIDWYWKDIVEQPYREGALEETNNFNQLIVAAGITGIMVKGIKVAPVEPEAVLFAQDYQRGLKKVYSSGFTQIKSLSDRTASQVMTQINIGVDTGKTPPEIAAAITDRFNVAKANAERIAVTEVNKIYNDSKMATNDTLSEQTGLRSGVIHISALIATTRPHHADRHGNAYTTVQQRQWWSEGVNRINCHCSIQSVLIDRNGRVVDSGKQEEIQAERSFFDD